MRRYDAPLEVKLDEFTVRIGDAVVAPRNLHDADLCPTAPVFCARLFAFAEFETERFVECTLADLG